MSDNRYIVTRSNYTIKSTHKQLSSDTIYERDYMTTSNLGGWDSGAIPYGEGNFKFIHGDDINQKRKHKYGEWLKPTDCGEEGNEYWDLECTGSGDSSSTESRIIRKPNYTSFKDFVYYGNCTKLIKSGIEEIISKYPGELFVSDKQYTYTNVTGGTSVLGGNDKVIIKNPFKIDIVSPTMPTDGIEYRYFCNSVDDYLIIDTSGNTYDIDSWEVNLRKKTCFTDGNIVANIKLYYNTISGNTGSTIDIIQYYYGGEKVLLTDDINSGIHIKLKQTVIKTIFDGFDTFSNFLLNQNSNPIYTITVEHPYDTDRGVLYVNEKLTWPVNNGWNLDISSKAYSSYINTLIDIASWYDENRADNIWRCMTYESIKTMDKTFVNTKTNEDNEDFKIGTANIQALLQIYGKFFDNIKFDIDNIKYTNKVTYDDKNNAPDYFLTDKLNMSGWEICSVVPNFNKELRTDALFLGNSKNYSPAEANVSFLKNLAINTKALTSRKGTRECIEMMLSLFGLTSYDWAMRIYNALPESKKKKQGNRVLQWDKLPESARTEMYDYTINEEVAVASNSSSDVVPLSSKTCAEEINEYKEDYYTENNTDALYGLPARMVVVSTINDSGETEEYKYLIPWFDKDDRLDNKPYFHMYGGWGKLTEKTITPDDTLYPNTTKISTNLDFTIYSETVKYLKTVKTIKDLSERDYSLLNDGDIYYVEDISDFNEYYPYEVESAATHYFIIEDKENLRDYQKEVGEYIECGATRSATVSEFKTNREVLSSFHSAGGKLKDWTYASGDTIVVNISSSSAQTPYFAEASDTATTYGWKNISTTEFTESAMTNNALKVIYLNSIIEDGKGNNPHVGYGSYDGGNAYFNIFKQLFLGAIEEDLFGPNAYDCETGALKSEIYDCGFTLTEHVVDNMKCWYFTDNSKEKDLYRLVKRDVTVMDEDLDTYNIQSGYKVMTVSLPVKDDEGKYSYQEVPYTDKVNVGKTAYAQKESNFRSELSAFNFETQEDSSNDESAANSIINSKILNIFFNKDKYYNNDDFHKYFENAILPYLTQVIPSTTIFSAEYAEMVKVTFMDGDGETILEEKLTPKGWAVTYTGSKTPYKESESGITYVFIGWNPSINDNVYKDTIYYPVFAENAYLIQFVNYDGTLLQSGLTQINESPIYMGETPSRENSGCTRYEYSGWTDDDEIFYEKSETLPIATKCVTYTVNYDEQTIQYLIEFFNVDFEPISSITTDCGTVPSIGEPSYPTGWTKEGEQYTFSGWTDENDEFHGKDIPEATEDMKYYAKYGIKFLIRFLNDSTVLQSGWYNLLDIPNYSGSTPTKEPEAQWEFSGWNPSIGWVTKKQDYVAKFDVREHTIKFVNDDGSGTTLQESQVKYGDYAEYSGSTPSREPSIPTGYTFDYWEDTEGNRYETKTTQFKQVTTAETYTAKYSQYIITHKLSLYDSFTGKDTFIITFENYDGTMLQSELLESGVTPEYKGSTPTKPSTVQYTYTFDGWLPDGIKKVTEDTTYTAHYATTLNKYLVEFKNGGTAMQSGNISYGEYPVYTGSTPTTGSSTPYSAYTFNGWIDSDGNQYEIGEQLKMVTTAETYTAIYSGHPREYTINFYNTGGTELLTSATVYYNESVPMPKIEPQPKYKEPGKTYIFIGWTNKETQVLYSKTLTELPFINEDNKYIATYVVGTSCVLNLYDTREDDE